MRPGSGLRFNGSTALPNSAGPQVLVSGAFTGGGSSLGRQQVHELNIEFDDDAILTTKAHTLKFGAQLQSYIRHLQLTSGFNGSYVYTSLAQISGRCRHALHLHRGHGLAHGRLHPAAQRHLLRG